MNLPKTVDDPSFLKHTLIRDHVLMYSPDGQSRSNVKNVVNRFAEAVQQDDRVAAAIKSWAYLVFQDVFSDENSLETMDRGEELYKVFLEYQSRLLNGLEYEAREYAEWLVNKGGINAAKLKHRTTNTQHHARERGNQGRSKGDNGQRSSRQHKISGSKRARHQVQTVARHPDAGDITMNSSLDCGPHPTMGSSVNDTLATGTRLSVLPSAPTSRRSTSKRRKKRKAGPRRPVFITPELSEDDREPSKTHVVSVADSISHQPEQIIPNSCRPQCDLEKNQVDKKNPAHIPETKQRREDVCISQPRRAPTSVQSDDIVCLPGVKDRRGAKLSLKNRKHEETRTLNVSTQGMRVSSNPGRLWEIGSVKSHRATKRSRRASMSALDGELGEGSKSIRDLQVKGLQEFTTQRPPVTCPSLTQENSQMELKARRKRTRPEFETGPAVSPEELSFDTQESLGSDTRPLRPLPQKVCDAVADKDMTVCGVLRGSSSPEHVDQFLRDVASSALAGLQEEARADIQDWTQDSEHEVECDDFDGHEADEADDAWVTTETSDLSIPIPKPPVLAPPRIWAQSRQEVCESFEYFRSYHSGVYCKDDIVRGYLLGAYATSRDIFHHGGKLIVSHGGGKSECILDSRRGPRRYQTDQDQEASDKSVRALLKTHKDRRPVALLADDKYALFPYDLTSANYTYVVLGLYWISHAWAECQSARDGIGRVVRWKFAFQWCEGQGDPWWAPQQEMTEITPDPPKPISNLGTCFTQGSSHSVNTDEDSSTQCKDCQVQSPFIYKQGWMCLNPHCNVFWSINGEDPEQLDYREDFLSLLPQKFERMPNLTPSRVVEIPGRVTTAYAFSKGWHCTKCGRLSCRYKWECWECSNCLHRYVVNGRLRSAKEFWNQRLPKGFMHSHVGKDSGILASGFESIYLGTNKGFSNRLTFTLPHNRGTIHLILGTALSNGDADNIFQLYQQQASTGELKLRRYPLQNHRARGRLLTNYFSQNSGEPYQYVGGSGHTVPFCDAPQCVRRALKLIEDRARIALNADISFNEVLSAAYMERQKMSFHSDSEKGLGPTVASLSLGSAALMHFRPHVSIDNPRGKDTYALTLVLRHGDVLVMQGSDVQKHYEHTVVPMNFRIAATARYIGPT